MASAGVPTRRPRGDHRRPRVERDGVAVDRDADLVQPVLGLLAVELGVAQVDEHEVHVGAAGEDVDAVAGAEQRGGDGLGAVDRALLALAELLGRGDPERDGLGGDRRASAGRPAGRGRPPELIFFAYSSLAEDHAAARRRRASCGSWS